jgi:plasmid stabilization system protein ParE
LIPFSREATQQVVALRRHYEFLGRLEATTNLLAALRDASNAIERDPTAGLPAPRPYPQFARPGQAWVKAGRYWIAYRRHPRLVIAAVFYDTANIPNRM